MGAYNILLVDDEPKVTDALRRVLHGKSFKVFVANSANDALGVLAEEQIDVVVSDELMPGVSGSEFLGIVCARYPNTVRIMLTGHPNLDTALRAINMGHIYRFLTKPCGGPELSLAIRQGIQHRDLSSHSQSLLDAVRRQNTVLEELEKRHPGIARVERDTGGAVEIPDVEYDMDSLIREIKGEVERSRSILKAQK